MFPARFNVVDCLCCLFFTGNSGYVCRVRDVRSRKCIGCEQSLRVADTVQPSSFSHVHVSYACRCIRSGKEHILINFDLFNLSRYDIRLIKKRITDHLSQKKLVSQKNRNLFLLSFLLYI